VPLAPTPGINGARHERPPHQLSSRRNVETTKHAKWAGSRAVRARSSPASRQLSFPDAIPPVAIFAPFACFVVPPLRTIQSAVEPPHPRFPPAAGGLVSRFPRGGSRQTSGGWRVPGDDPVPRPRPRPAPSRNSHEFRYVPRPRRGELPGRGGGDGRPVAWRECRSPRWGLIGVVGVMVIPVPGSGFPASARAAMACRRRGIGRWWFPARRRGGRTRGGGRNTRG